MSAFQPVPPPLLAPDLPTMYELPSENPEEPGLPDEFHGWQPQLLSQTFRPLAYPPDQVFTAADLNLYYDPRHTRWYKRPDWFAVVGVPRLVDRGRLSYVLWQEGRVPSVVVEVLSPNTIEEDQGLTLRGRTPPSKWEVYERILRVPDYVLFNREANILQLFRLDGAHYRELNEERLWIEELGIGLGVWEGKFMEVERPWLRWYDAEGGWLPTEVERAVATERQRAEALAARLRALGVDPESL